MELNLQQGLKWGIIGPGNIARDFIHDMKLVRICPNRVTSVMSNDPDEAADFAHEFGVARSFNHIHEMLEEGQPDIVYVSTPHALHFEQTMECLRRQVPVLCEKPLALNQLQASEMIAEARRSHTFLLDGMWIRFLPSLKKVLELIDQRAIGNINSVAADMSYLAPVGGNNRFYNPDLGGGSLLDLGIYPVYLMLLVLGMPSSIKATAIFSTEGIDVNCAAILEYDEGENYGMIESSIIKETDKRARIYGEKGFITMLAPWNERSAGILVSLYDGAVTNYPCRWDGRGFQFEMTEIVECLLDKQIESEKHSHEDSLRLIRVLDEIRAQAKITYPLYE